ncbi:unnamed protein product [Rhizophagus irregularis]|uniref:MYND-type domain-containing protein n=2 Tax=Rhizophagus irregularis TaxID=588596 RepID=A0A915Z0J6_9GLOM|nr:unnamed protein product [Rhizophagus irregularis]CAB5216822.1 unnamed protein product [Rhizophagus irregularis]CAB5357523.1 unnamed protein product [Rhizophagus irregularis]
MKCSICEKPTTQRCSRCHTKYYCSKSCQKEDYPNHVRDCPSRSAEILVKDVFSDTLPTNYAVRYEYGFCNCVYPEEESMLLGLYGGLIKYIECSASQLHSWWKSGNLPFHIKKAFEDSNTTSGYYQWFLKNEHVLQGLRKYEGEKSNKEIANKLHAMVKPYLSEHDLTVPIKSLPETKRIVCLFYITILSDHIPGIDQQNWIDFGFCSCKFGSDHLGEIEERRLADLYKELIIQEGCKVDEFHDAYLSGTILDLLRKYCSSNNCNWLSENKIEVRGHNQPNKSVYDLKQYALSESARLVPSVNVDYGFMNCRTESEKRQLKHTYRKLIKTPRFDPRDLHCACIAGKTFDYVRSILPNEGLKANLFKNPYPLKEID